MAMVCSGGSRPGVIAARGWSQTIECESPRSQMPSAIRNVFYATVERAVLNLAARRQEAVMKLSGRFFSGGRLSFEQLVIKLADSIVPVLVFTEFRLGDAAESLLFQNIQLGFKKHYEFATDMLRIMEWHDGSLSLGQCTKAHTGVYPLDALGAAKRNTLQVNA